MRVEATRSSIREHQRPQPFNEIAPLPSSSLDLTGYIPRLDLHADVGLVVDPGDALLLADIITAGVVDVPDFPPNVGCFGSVDKSTTIADRIATKLDGELSSFGITDPADASPSSGLTAITYSPPFQTTPLGL